MRSQVLEQIERRGIDPLEVVKKKCKWMLRLCKYTDKPAEHGLETGLRILRREILNLGLLSDDEFKLRNEIYDELSILTESVLQPGSPAI